MPFFYGYDLQMSYVQQSQPLYSQDMASQATPQTPTTPQTTATPQTTTPQTQGGTGYTIPVHCGLLTLISDLNNMHNDIKAAAGEVRNVAGGILLNDPVPDITKQLQELRDKLTGLPVLKLLADTEIHKANASQMHMENKSLKAQVKELTRELKEAKDTVAALTEEEEHRAMSQDET